MESLRPINKIILHCSASAFGNTETIEGWHRERAKAEPWLTYTDEHGHHRYIGYHFVILNGVEENMSAFVAAADGVVEIARPVEVRGCHCKGDNDDSIGICLIGILCFTPAQLRAAQDLVIDLRKKYNPNAAIWGHNERASGMQQKKSCPNFNMARFRERVEYRQKGEYHAEAKEISQEAPEEEAGAES